MAYAKDKDEDDDKKDTKKMSKKEVKEFLEKAQKRLDAAIKADEHNRTKAIEDLKFLNGEQWDPAEKQRRNIKSRPCLQVNLLPKFINQLIGEQRQNRPKIKVRPVDSKADVDIAKIREGIISNIEYLSKADTIYDMAYSMAVRCGYGAWQVCTRYTDDNPFEQEIYLEFIPNPFVIYLDPAAKDPLGSDAMWGFKLCKMSREKFEEDYPDAELPSDQALTRAPGITYENWFDKDNVTVAEYFVKSPKKEKVCQLSDGRVMSEDDAKEAIKTWKDEQKEKRKLRAAMLAQQQAAQAAQAQQAQPPMQSPGTPTMQPGQPQVPQQMPPSPPAPMQAAPPQAPPIQNEPELEILKTKESEAYEVKQYIITCIEILEEHKSAGQYIPLVPVYGREMNIEGKRYIEGLIRNAKDSQKMYNYWYTSAAETIALAPKSPWVGSAKMFEGYEKDYAAAHTDNIPYLKAKHDPNFPGQLPSRQAAAQPPVAIFNALQVAQDDMMSSLGMFKPDLGDQGKAISAVAIRQQQKPGDIATFEFYDNFVRSVEHSGRIINDMIPYYYDTERDVRLRNSDDTETFVPVNTTTGDALQKMQQNPAKYTGMDIESLKRQIQKKGMDAEYNNIKAGKYGTVVTTGPTHATQRQESAENLLQLMQTPLGDLISKTSPDIVVKNMDFLDADEVAKRLRKTLPQGLYEPKAGEKPMQPLPPNPITQGQMQLQQMKQQTESDRQKKEQMQLKVALVKLYKETKESETEIKKEILKVLAELHAPQHPADAQLMQQMMGGQRQMAGPMQ
jgi:hypothetical protein